MNQGQTDASSDITIDCHIFSISGAVSNTMAVIKLHSMVTLTALLQYFGHALAVDTKVKK